MNNLVEMHNGNLTSLTGESLDELIDVGQMLEEASAVSFEELSLFLPERFNNNTKSMKSIFNLKLPFQFPIFLLFNRNRSFIVNLYQLAFDYPDLDSLFDSCGQPPTHEIPPEAPRQERKPSNKGVRKPLTTLIPGLAEEITCFYKITRFQSPSKAPKGHGNVGWYIYRGHPAACDEQVSYFIGKCD